MGSSLFIPPLYKIKENPPMGGTHFLSWAQVPCSETKGLAEHSVSLSHFLAQSKLWLYTYV